MSACTSSRRLLVLGTASLLLLGIGAGALVADRADAASDLTPTGTQAFSDIAGCAASGGDLLAAIVVDSSGSLRQTDPQNLRVAAINTAIDALEDLQTTRGDTGTVRASLSTFGTSFTPLVGWDSVTPDHAQVLRTAAERELPSSNRDLFTDYRQALQGAQRLLDDEAAASGRDTCKVLFWFTDGKLDIENRNVSLAGQTDLARSQLCGPQGIVDSLRADRISIIALALFIPNSGVDGIDRSRLQAIAEGTSAAESCGTVPIPESSSVGASLTTDDTASIRRLFAQAGAMIEGATSPRTLLCPGPTCSDGRLTIPVDAGVDRFRIVFETTAGTTPPTLISPSGETTPLIPGVSQIGGAEVGLDETDGLQTLEVTLSDTDEGVGSWILATNPAHTTVIDLYYFWDVAPLVEAGGELTVGESNSLDISLQDANGARIDIPDSLAVDLEILIDDQPVTAVANDDSTWSAEVDVAASDVAPVVRVKASFSAVTSPSGIALGPRSTVAELPAVFSASFPTVATAELAFPDLVGADPSEAIVTFVGSDEGETQACFLESNVAGPDDAGTIDLSLPECVAIPTGQSVEAPISLTSQSSADGVVSGSVSIELTEAGGGSRVVQLNLPVTATMVRPVDEPLRWGLVALFVLLALAIYWAMAELARWIADRYSFSAQAKYASVPVAVTADGISRRNQKLGAPLLDAFDDFEPMPVSGRVSGFSVAGLTFGRRFPISPTNPGRGTVADDSERMIFTSARTSRRGDDARRAAVDLPGALGWVLTIDSPSSEESGHELTGRLVMIIDSGDGVSSVLDSRLTEIAGVHWSEVVELASVAQASRTASAQSEAPVVARATAANSAGSTAADADIEPEPEQAPSSLNWDDDLGPASNSGSSSGSAPDSRNRLRRKSDRRDRGTTPPTDPPTPPSTLNFWD